MGQALRWLAVAACAFGWVACRGRARDQDAAAKFGFVFAKGASGALPISLTASDGTGLAIESLDAKLVIDPPLAFTQLELAFQNPEARRIEGRFEIVLGPGASVSRLALQMGDQYQEGEVVERAAAQSAYEEGFHRRRDPALLEREAGNRYRMRVFPIEAHETKHVIVAFTELLPSGAPYRLRLDGLPEIGRLDVDATLERGARKAPPLRARLSRREFQPKADLELAFDRPSANRVLRDGELALIEIEPPAYVESSQLERLTLLFDTSASSAAAFSRQANRLRAIVGALERRQARAFPVQLVAFDQTLVPLFEAMSDKLGPELETLLGARGALGATDLEAALRGLAGLSGLGDRVLVFTDGIATAGRMDEVSLYEATAALGRAGVRRLDLVPPDGTRDQLTLEALAQGQGLPEAGSVLDESDAERAADRLLVRGRRGVGFEVEDAEWTSASTLPVVEPGRSYFVWAKLAAERPLRFRLEGHSFPLASGQVQEKALFGHEWAHARIEALEHDHARLSGAAKERVHQELVSLGCRHRVSSDATAWVVLESADYVRHGIARSSLSDVPVVRDGRVAMAEQAQPVTGAVQPAAAQDQVGTIGQGSGTASFAQAPQRPLGIIGVEAPVRRTRQAMPDDAEDTRMAGILGVPRPAPAVRGPEHALGTDPSGALGALLGTGLGTGALGLNTTGRGDGFGGATHGVARAAHAAAPNARPRQTHRAALRPRDGELVLVQRPPDVRALREAEWQRRPRPRATDNLSGPLLAIANDIERGRAKRALAEAWRWHREEPEDVLALVALGMAAEDAGERELAARAYGSLIDRFPARPEYRRIAGERLEGLSGDALELAIDSYEKAAELRPDQPSSQRLYGLALLRAGRPSEAYDALLDAYTRSYANARFPGVHEQLLEDLRLTLARMPSLPPGLKRVAPELLEPAALASVREPGLQLALYWETDATDVDLHVYDGHHGHAFAKRPVLDAGASLRADVREGYGPEFFSAEGGGLAYPYEVLIEHAGGSPAGYTLGAVQVLSRDGRGELSFETRPFVIMTNGAWVSLGSVARPAS